MELPAAGNDAAAPLARLQVELVYSPKLGANEAKVSTAARGGPWDGERLAVQRLQQRRRPDYPLTTLSG